MCVKFWLRTNMYFHRKNFRLVFWIGFVTLITGCAAIRDLRIKVPSAVKRGEDAVLECLYDLEGDQLYSVKWYRGTTEFYRYNPNESPSKKQFRSSDSGLVVRLKESNATCVVLATVPRSVSGKYSCEVTADQPSFFTDIQSGYLQVVDLPAKDPYISGLKSRYRFGETLKANCTSEHSSPEANLTWSVNGNPVKDFHVRRYKQKSSNDGYFYTASSHLQLQVTKTLFAKGRLKIRCTATMYSIYYRSSEKSVELEKKKQRHQSHYYNHLTTTSSTSTEEPAPLGQWELARARETQPETTLIFYDPTDNGCSTYSKWWSIPAMLLVLFRR